MARLQVRAAPTGDGGTDGSGDAPLIDAVLPPGCTGPEPSRPQCSNCIDDDGDGAIDSLDLECTMPLDQAEASFANGIPTDIVAPVHPDCFFDGNTRSTDDGCQIHVCCLLGAASRTQCPIGASQYNPNQCPPPIGNTPLSQTCLDTCGPLTLPGCDCFGCCTICDPATHQCHDVELDPSTSQSCEPQTIADPTSASAARRSPAAATRCAAARPASSASARPRATCPPRATARPPAPPTRPAARTAPPAHRARTATLPASAASAPARSDRPRATAPSRPDLALDDAIHSPSSANCISKLCN